MKGRSMYAAKTWAGTHGIAQLQPLTVVLVTSGRPQYPAATLGDDSQISAGGWFVSAHGMRPDKRQRAGWEHVSYPQHASGFCNAPSDPSIISPSWSQPIWFGSSLLLLGTLRGPAWLTSSHALAAGVLRLVIICWCAHDHAVNVRVRADLQRMMERQPQFGLTHKCRPVREGM